MQEILFWLALVLYGSGIVLILPSVIRGRPSLSAGALSALGAGLISHAAGLIASAIQIHRLPVTDVRSALSFFSFLTTLAFFLAYLRYRITALGIFMLPLVFVLTLISTLHPDRSFASGAFRSGWLAAHIGSIFLGYTGFFLTFVAAIMYLLQEGQLKSKQPRAFYYRLPSLEVCEQLYVRSLYFGLPFLSLGILTGFLWASRAWQGPWEFDPKILSSVVTWLIYLLLFSTRISGSWRGRRAAYVAIVAFGAVMVTFLGVSFLSGQHGYAPNPGPRP